MTSQRIRPHPINPGSRRGRCHYTSYGNFFYYSLYNPMLKQSLKSKLDKLAERQNEIHALLSDPQVINNQNRFRELSKEDG